MVLNKLQKLRLGSRGSPLALIQAAMVQNMILQEYPQFDGHVEIIPITTKGDQFQTSPLSEFGGKGVFTKEIDAALLDGRIDAAVHSMKDVESVLPNGLTIVSVLPREDPREFLLSSENGGIADLPKGAVVGTSSPRRKAQLLNRRPDLRIVMLRGNVGTRLQKLSNGDVDATLLALAGLRRLGCSPVGSIIQPEEMLPSVAQGVIGIQVRDDSSVIRDLLSGFCHTETYNCVTAERAMLAAFGGSCRTPIGALATYEGKEMCLRTKLFSGDGSKVFSTERKGSVDDAEFMGRDAGTELKHIMPTNLPASWS